eukprot:TRINITY_DN9496_c0_g1_i1.p2 TRINITY_DN9496_c0_g1~~TRINITY_DN9496_c0_g1_i1.p2  ORF type:complete len:102 (+),score=15.36 TRINITY_DN9496_c0_g1_i1:917-1222(+)
MSISTAWVCSRASHSETNTFHPRTCSRSGIQDPSHLGSSLQTDMAQCSQYMYLTHCLAHETSARSTPPQHSRFGVGRGALLEQVLQHSAAGALRRPVRGAC